MSHDELKSQLIHLEEATVITTPERNLRSKIDSLTRAIENMSEKKIRLDFEIKKQKKALIRKRNELKKVQSSLSAKSSLVIENEIIFDDFPPAEDYLVLRRIDSKLLQESDRVLNN